MYITEFKKYLQISLVRTPSKNGMLKSGVLYTMSQGTVPQPSSTAAAMLLVPIRSKLSLRRLRREAADNRIPTCFALVFRKWFGSNTP